MGSIFPHMYRNKINEIKDCICEWRREMGKAANEEGYSLPIQFADKITECLMKSCEICGELKTLIDGLKKDSKVKPEYEQLLSEVTSYKDELEKMLLDGPNLIYNRCE